MIFSVLSNFLVFESPGGRHLKDFSLFGASLKEKRPLARTLSIYLVHLRINPVMASVRIVSRYGQPELVPGIVGF